MATSNSAELTNSPEGLPRRRAIQGVAGSLAGIAALGAINASAKKKKKGNKGNKGKLARFDSAEETDSIPTTTVGTPTTTLTVDCPAAGSNEQVFATGGGFDATEGVPPLLIATASQATASGDGWQVTFYNQGVAADATVSVVCAYFKTK